MGQGGRQREKSNLILCLNVFISCLFQNVLSQLIPFKDHFDNIFLQSRRKKHTSSSLSVLWCFYRKASGILLLNFRARQTSNISVMFFCSSSVKVYGKKGLISIVFYYSDGFLTRGKMLKRVIRLLSKLVKIEDDFMWNSCFVVSFFLHFSPPDNPHHCYVVKDLKICITIL